MYRFCFSLSFLVCSLLLLFSCKSTKDFGEDTEIFTAEFEERTLDTLMILGNAPGSEKYVRDTYRGSATRLHDLIHTKLELAFDWQKQHVLGKAELTLKPMFYETSELILDAKIFDFHSITMNGKNLDYDYDDSKLTIELDKTYKRTESYTIQIDYTAKPNEGPSGGSQAISSDKGLFFINPLKENKVKPQQIWTQGETENSSRWFPTIDKPNERCSQEVHITVQDRFETLSNGLLIDSKKNSDGTRTDVWKQEKPHAPYLFMIGVGEYAVVKGSWKDKELLYYVEPEYEEHAEKIFNHTPEMLTFFSDILGYEYPWDKYAQIVCRDYVSGAMENTGAVVFGDFVQRTERELLDGNNNDIVAHEMIHHWFGDLVTCESWSNLTLNEGFATYGEYLWQEYKYGHEAAERKRIEDLNGYVMTADRGGTHDLIDFEYDDKEDMFDGHSYNKGGLIVHMLRSLVGDEAFFASIKRYLTAHEYTDVESHELRLAFEDVTGQDLNWFFNQWFFGKGHPILDVDYNIVAADKKVVIKVSQTQDAEDNVAVFRLPVKTALYYESGKVEHHDLVIDKRYQEFEIPFTGTEVPAIVVLDGAHDLLSINRENRTSKDYVKLFELSDEYEDKFVALSKLKGKAAGYDITRAAISSPSVEMRLIATNSLDGKRDEEILKKLVINDTDSKIRVTALKKLKDYDTALIALKNDRSYRVIGEALDIVNRTNNAEGILQAEQLTKSYHRPLIGSIGDILSDSKDIKYLDYFEDNMNSVTMFAFFNYMSQYTKLAKLAEPDRMVQTALVLKQVASEESNTYFKKYSATNSLKTLMKELEKRPVQDEATISGAQSISNFISSVINSSQDKRLRGAFSEYIDTP